MIQHVQIESEADRSADPELTLDVEFGAAYLLNYSLPMVSPNPELSGRMSLLSISKSASTIFSMLETKYEASLITEGLNVPKSLHMFFTSSGFIPMPVSETVNRVQLMLIK